MAAAELKVQPKPNSGLYEIVTNTGILHGDLVGAYTSRREAQLAIQRLKRKVHTNAKQTGRRKLTTKTERTQARNEAGEGKLDAATGKYKSSK